MLDRKHHWITRLPPTPSYNFSRLLLNTVERLSDSPFINLNVFYTSKPENLESAGIAFSPIRNVKV